MQKITKLYILFSLVIAWSTISVKSQNLLPNGDFETSGGFQSNYNLITPSGNSNAGDYAIVSNSQPMNSVNFIASGDHTSGSGKMMVVDGRNSDIFWKQNPNLALQGGSTYIFSYYIKNINTSLANQPKILFTPADQCDAACGTSVTLLQGNSDVGLMPAGWQKVSYRFTPSAPGTKYIRIELSTINAGLGGNDFAIDDLTLTLLPPCSPPTVTSPVYLCQGSAATALSATPPVGSTLLWYTASTGGIGSSTAPVPSTASNGTVTYYVTQTNGICESSPRTPITVNVNSYSGTYGMFCDQNQITTSPPSSLFFDWQNLLAPAPHVYHLAYSINGGPLITVPGTTNLSHWEVFGVLPGQSVTLTIVSNEGVPCVGSESKTCTLPCNVSVTPTFASLPSSICSGSTAPTLPLVSDNGITGTWTPSTINNTTSGSYVFTPTGSALCVDTVTKGITVIPAPNAGTLSGTQTACVGSTTTFSSTTPGGGWVSSNLGVATINSTTGVITGLSPGTAIMTYSVNGTPPCSNATAIRNVTITAGPNAGTLSGSQAICASQTTNFSPTVAGGTWSSSNIAIATVNTTGVVTGISGGTATITYTVAGTPPCSNAIVTRTVTVTALPVAGTLSGTQGICVGLSTTFSSTTAGGSWSSSNNAIATINTATGVVTGVAAGTATMTYTVTGTGGCSNVTATRTVTVTAVPNAGTLGGTQAVCVGLTTTFTSTVAGGSWSSSNATIATVNTNNGLVTGVAAGTATITYTVTGTGGCGNVIATRTVTVTAVPNAGTLSGTQAVCVGLTTTFTSTITGGAWSSSNNAIATINASTGMITGVGAGTATMTYTVTGTGGCNNVTATRTVTVTSVPNAGTLNGTQGVCAGLATTFSATVAGGSWSSSNTAIATVNTISGVVTGVSAGTATINYTITGTGGCGNVTATRAVTVTTAPNAGTLSGITNICIGSTSTIATSGSGGNWSSSNPAIVTVNASGVITGIAAGNATITYKVIGTGGCSDVTATISATITTPPNAGTLSGNQSICEGTTTAFSTTGIGGNWTSSNTSVATVSASGLVSGVAPGTAVITYKVLGTGGCSDAVATRNITIIARQTPTFNQVAPICAGNPLAALPLNSLNGFSGTWSPAINNNSTTIYTFTPNTTSCATTTTMEIVVRPKLTPDFVPIATQCHNDPNVPVLPLSSPNGVTGTWSPAAVSLATLGNVTYTFTPNPGQCVTANSFPIVITVVPITITNFQPIAPFCIGKTPVPTLENISPNGVEGTWLPAVIDNSVAGTFQYHFTPNTVLNQCATLQTLTVTVIAKTVPNFVQIAPFCVNTTAPVFTNVSPNGIPGTWSPAIIDNTFVGTQSYEFTPASNQCATNLIMNIVTTPGIKPTFKDIVLCKTDLPPVLQNVSPNGINGTWTPPVIDMSLVGTNPYVFTPNVGECGVPQTINVTVNEYRLNNIEGIVSNYFENDQIITVIATGPGDYLYQLDYGPLQEDNVFHDVPAGLHTVKVVDKNGCGPSLSDPNILVINYPKFFTPNGDGYNDTWNIKGLPDPVNAKIFIFDRYGKLITQIDPSGKGWDGTYNERQLPSTDYWFTIDYYENNVPKQFKAHFSLKR